MKSIWNKRLSLPFAISLVTVAPFSCTNVASCSTLHSIQLANFESYMDRHLMEYLSDKYDVQYQWFTVAEMIPTKFEKVYDIAIPSSYEVIALYEKDWLQKIDWSSFEIKDQDGNTIQTSLDAMNLFAEPIQDAINKMNNDFRNYLGKNDFNILDYGVPYFAQSMMFVYKGDVINFYENGTTNITQNPTWADIFYTIGPKNPNLDLRFRDRRIGMLDDAKTIYDLSRIVQTIEQNPLDKTLWNNEMPDDDSIPNLVNTFSTITSKSDTNWYTLNTDSGIISRNLADHKKESYVATLSWSGDALYSALGAEEFDPYTGDQMHIVRPYGASLDEIEFVVMNKKNHGTEREDRSYQIIKEICLDGCDAVEDEICEENEDGTYKHWAMQNWDQINYTPILNSIYQYVVNSESDYWDDYISDEDLNPNLTRNLYASILSMTNQEYASSNFGHPLKPIQNSNTHWAWLESRGNL